MIQTKTAHLKLGLILLMFFASACTSIPRAKDKQSPQYTIQITTSPLKRAVASEAEKKVIVKSCVSLQNCQSDVKSLTYTEFALKLQKKIEVKSFVSQQISLLEQQAASLRVDRESLIGEVEEFDRNLKTNRMSSLRNVTENIRRLRASIKLEIQELDQKLALTEKDLQVLKSPVKSRSGYSLETAKMLDLLELGTSFGASLIYQDNLIAQALDSIAREMI